MPDASSDNARAGLPSTSTLSMIQRCGACGRRSTVVAPACASRRSSSVLPSIRTLDDATLRHVGAQVGGRVSR